MTVQKNGGLDLRATHSKALRDSQSFSKQVKESNKKATTQSLKSLTATQIKVGESPQDAQFEDSGCEG